MPLSIQHTYRRKLAPFLMVLSPVIALVGCSNVPLSVPPAKEATAPRQISTSKTSNNAPALPPAGSGRGAYYLDDGPGDDIPKGLLDLPDAEPKVEPYAKSGNRSYVVFGKRYTPFTDGRPFKQRGIGSWYGKKFHGQKTSSGELYDMYKMTAAHPTLPLPSYARVTNVENGKQVIVRVNDRGPFHSSRIIDLSYAAALKLGYLAKGKAELEVERLLPDEIERIASSRREQEALVDASMVPAAPLPAANQQPGTGQTEQAAPTAATSAPGFYLQFGVYSQAGNAEAARARLMQQWDSTRPPIQVVGNGTQYRLHGGPFATRAEAAMAALQMESAGAAKPIIVQR